MLTRQLNVLKAWDYRGNRGVSRYEPWLSSVATIRLEIGEG